MPAGKIVVEFDSGAASGGQTLNYELGKLNLSGADWLRATLEVETAAEDAGDTCDVYLQSRGPDGNWEDRIHFSQITGDMSPSGSAPEVRTATLQQAGTLSDDEEESEPSGSAGGSRLTAGTVRNGPFPGVYRDGSGRGASWRVQVVVVDADSDGQFAGSVYIEWNEAV